MQFDAFLQSQDEAVDKNTCGAPFSHFEEANFFNAVVEGTNWAETFMSAARLDRAGEQAWHA